MTDRINALTVCLEQNIREDDIEPLLAAIRQLRGVLDVQPHVADMESYVAEQRARQELRDKLWELLKADLTGGTP